MSAKFYFRAAACRLVVAMAVVCAGLGQVAAQSTTQWDSLYDRIIRLEHKLRSMEAGGVQQPAATPLDPAASASQSLRIDQIEGDLRTLLGQVQNLAHQVQQLNSRLKRFSEDAEYRLEQLESGDRSRNKTSSDPKRTAKNSTVLPDYGDLSTLEQYPQESNTLNQDTSTFDDVEAAPGTQTLGTIPGSSLDPETTTLSAVPDAVTSQPLDDNSAVGGADVLYETSYNHLLRRRFGAAESGFAKFIKKYRKHKLAGNAQYWLGESYYARGRYKQAAKAFLTGYRDFSKSPKAPDSMLKLGMSLRQLGQKKHACNTFKQIKARFPKASASVKKLAVRERKRAGCGA